MAGGITRIAVEGFKSIAKRQEIEIRPLTILAGANSSGKSAIMQPLLMLKQTLEATYDPGPLKIDGPNVTFSEANEFLSRHNDPQALGVELRIGGSQAIGWTFRRPAPSSALHVMEQWWGPDGELRRIQSNLVGVSRDRFDLYVKADIPPPIDLIRELIQDTIHVPGLRGTKGRLYPAAGVGPLFPGTFDYYHASVILQWQQQAKGVEAAGAIVRDLQHVGLARRLVARRIGDVAIQLDVGLDDDPRRMDNIADVGFGVSQVLPPLVALRVAEPGRLVYLEEPEIHLHPLAQTKLAAILAGAAKRGVRVVAETHSTLLLTAIQTLVAKGELSPDLVKLHWFQRDPATGITQVTSADLDENGAFGDWPEDFDKVILDTDSAYLDAVEGRQVG